MSRKSVFLHVLLGVCATLLLLGASLYSVIDNESRWVIPMDLSTYVFRPQDLPMLAATGLFAAFWFYLAGRLVVAVCVLKNKAKDSKHTRTLNPKLGLLGILGVLGFLGIWTYQAEGVVFPFLFFTFFGFFGFFYEGKLSNLLMDERYRENSDRAQLKALKTGFGLLFLAVIVGSSHLFWRHIEHCAIFLTITLSLCFALVLFLSEYLLYRYDQIDAAEDKVL